jgi:phosphogluconate dehydratase
MSGASGKVPACIHVAPEAVEGGLIAKVRDGDRIRVDAEAGVLEVLEPGIADRVAAAPDLTANSFGIGRELFSAFREFVGPVDSGASLALRASEPA